MEKTPEKLERTLTCIKYSYWVSNFDYGRNFIALKYIYGANASAKLSRFEFNLGKYVPFVGDEIGKYSDCSVKRIA